MLFGEKGRRIRESTSVFQKTGSSFMLIRSYGYAIAQVKSLQCILLGGFAVWTLEVRGKVIQSPTWRDVVNKQAMTQQTHKQSHRDT